jgi:hypothetical protein
VGSLWQTIEKSKDGSWVDILSIGKKIAATFFLSFSKYSHISLVFGHGGQAWFSTVVQDL